VVVNRAPLIVAAALAPALLAGCGAGSPAAAEAEPEPPAATERAATEPAPTPATAAAVAAPAAAAPRCEPGSVRRLGSDRLAHAAVVRERATARRAPGGAVLARFAATNRNGVPTVFGVLAERVDARCRATWYRVRLPMKPNGATGWVRAGEVELAEVRTRIVVDLSARTVTLFRDGRVAIRTPAAIGSPSTPTPTGEYYVDQRLVPSDPGGPFGPGALGISAYSEVLTGWAQGGPIAIHGTNRPETIGQAVSNGCLRVPNDVLVRLFELAPAGTPVSVRA
jgi:lipoprotein-anchoring transpeptidase ErfK/SrfK